MRRVPIRIIMDRIAITVVAYNRRDSLQRLLDSLSAAWYDGGDDVPLYISVDKSGTDEVERFADAYEWTHGTKTVVRHDTNLGLRRHVMEQGRLLDTYDAIVVLEDDLLVAPGFWNYTRQTVARYKDCGDVAGISLYSFAVDYHSRHIFTPVSKGDDVYFMNCAMSWGQVWMKRQWQEFEAWYAAHPDFPLMPHLPISICSWGEKSWLRYHTRYCIEQDKYFVFPYVSYTTNHSEAGTHVRQRDCIFQVPLQLGRIDAMRLPECGGAVRYDGYFQNKDLYAALGLTERECCLDLRAINANREGKRYWLTTRRLPYATVREYDYAYRPLELNVLLGNAGTGIYLYDTTRPAPRPRAAGNPVALADRYMQNGFEFVREYGFRNTARDLLKMIKAKFL